MTNSKMIDNKELEQVAGGTFSDRISICRGCGREFCVTAGEQEYSAASGASFEYCRDCRAVNNMGNREPATLCEVICPRCGARANVPFKPLPGQVIYCSECFSTLRGCTS